VLDPVYRRSSTSRPGVFLRAGVSGPNVRDARALQNLGAYFRVSATPDGTPNPLVDFGFNVKDADGQPGRRDRLVGRLQRHPRHARGSARWATARLDLTLNGLPADVQPATCASSRSSAR
jgi:hypothetical protein